MRLKKCLAFLVATLCFLALLTACNYIPDFDVDGDLSDCEQNGHLFVKVYDEKHATCDQPGIQVERCERCGEQRNVEVPAAGHVEKVIPAVEATCTSEGKTEGKYCEVCEAVIVEPEPVLAPHKYCVRAIISPSQTLEGEVLLECESCYETNIHVLKSVADGEYTLVKEDGEMFTYTCVIDGVDIEFVVSNFIFDYCNNPHTGDPGYSIAGYVGNSTEIVIPSTFNDMEVCQISRAAFQNNHSITSVIIPETIVRIEPFAFADCDNLKSVMFKGILEIEEAAFFKCTSLKEVNLSASKLGTSAFEGCTALETVTFEYKEVSIHERAFANCTGLKSIDFPKESKLVYDGILSGAVNIESISMPGFQYSGKFASLFFNAGVDLEVIGELVPDSLKRVEITLNELQSYLDFKFFADCDNIEYISLSGVTYIPDQMFKGCKALKEIVISGEITDVGEDAFEGCDQLNFAESGNGKYIGVGDNPYYILVSCSDAICENGESELTLHSDTKVIGVCALSNSYITKITLPKGLTYVAAYALGFSYDSNITEVYFDGTMEDWCNIQFWDDSNPLVRGSSFYIKNGTDYQQVTEIVIPDTVETLGRFQFGELDFTTITIPVGLKYTNAKMPETLEKVYYKGTMEDWFKIEYNNLFGEAVYPMYYASEFYLPDGNGGWQEVTTVVIPESMTQIPSNLLLGFDNVDTVVIPETVTELGKYMFLGCTNLKNIFYKGTADKWETLLESEYTALENEITLYLYSEYEPNLNSDQKYWHYNSNNEPVAWTAAVSLVDGKTYNFSHTEVTVSDQYWMILKYYQEQGLLEEYMDPVQREMFLASSNKEEFAQKLEADGTNKGSGLTVSFANGTLTLSQNGDTVTWNCVERDGVIYVAGKAFFYIDTENDEIYEYNADDYTQIKQVYILQK